MSIETTGPAALPVAQDPPQPEPLRFLLVEDNPLDVELVQRELRHAGFEFTSGVVQTPEDFTREVKSNCPHVVLADYNLPQWRGIEALEILARETLDVPLILVTGTLGEVTAVDCIKQGVTDYVLKGALTRLPVAIRRALEAKDLRERQKRSEAALRESQAGLEALIQSAMDAILTVDEEQRIVVFNAAAEKMFLCSEAQAKGQLIDRFIPQRFHAAHSVHMKAFGETGATSRTMGKIEPLVALRSTGEEFAMEASISRAKVGNRTLFTVIMRDVTERQRTEKDLAEKVEELARSNRDLEQFAYVASHDLQEPLRMVAAYTQLLAERYRGKLDDNADKYIGYAVEGALRMQTLILDLLAFSRVGRADADRKNGECDAAIKIALANLQSAIEESGAVVTYDRLPAVAVGPTQLVQLFQNLIGNGIKFRGKEAPAIRVSAEKQDATWLFTVADNGIGISPQYKDKIFVIFQRLHTREEYSGNGVGLAICKKIVEHHGGRIWVASEPGCGATFHFTLPASPAEQGNHDGPQA